MTDALMVSALVVLPAIALIALVGLPLAMLLARARFRGLVVLETALLLPLVLPPTVVGYLLVLVLGRDGLAGIAGIDLLFTRGAAILAAVVVGLPLMVQASRAAIAAVDPSLEDAARTLGASELGVLGRVTLPLARRGVFAGLVLASARALGEFGATLMVAGNNPGRTQTMPLAIYDAVQSRQFALANLLVLILTGACFAALLVVRRMEGRRP